MYLYIAPAYMALWVYTRVSQARIFVHSTAIRDDAYVPYFLWEKQQIWICTVTALFGANIRCSHSTNIKYIIILHAKKKCPFFSYHRVRNRYCAFFGTKSDNLFRFRTTRSSQFGTNYGFLFRKMHNAIFRTLWYEKK